MPQISQTLEQNEEELLFQWKRLNPDARLGSDRLADYTDYSVGKECKITVEPNESNNIGLMLVVSDKRNGTAWYQQGQVTIIKPFNPCWFAFRRKKIKECLGLLKEHRKVLCISGCVPFGNRNNVSFRWETIGSDCPA